MINTLMLKAIVSAQNGIARLRDEEEAQTLTEYALIIAVIAIGVLVALYFLRDQIKKLFSKAGSSIDAVSGVVAPWTEGEALSPPSGPQFTDVTRQSTIEFERGESTCSTTLVLKAIVSAQNGIARLRDEEEAQTLTEYALIIAVIAIGVLVALYFLRDQITNLFSKAGSSVTA